MSLLLRTLAVASVLLAAGSASAQRDDTQGCPTDAATCTVEALYLNRVINGDTTATGARIREDRVYELQRDMVYYMDTDVRNDGYHLRIYGQEADAGAVPQVYTVLNADSGNPVGDPFGMQGDITFRNWAMAGVLPEEAGGDLANMSTRAIRVRAPGFDLVMDRFQAVNFVASVVRAQSALRKFEMTNSLWANIGWLGDNGTNFGAGKGIDLRDGSIDSLVIRNSTFVNFTDRIIRHRNSTAPLQNLVFDHNTILNAVSYHGTLALGLVGESVQITNNLFYDSFVAGADSSDVVRQEEFNESGELYANGQPAMHWISTSPADSISTEFTIANNAYVVTDEVETFYQLFGDGAGDDGNPDNGADGDNDIIGAGAPLTDFIRSQVSEPDAAFMAFDFDLSDAPSAPIDMVTWYRTETGRTKETITFDASTDDFDRRTIGYFLADFDASYPTTTDAYTLATGSCPAGDLNWFPGQFATCDQLATDADAGPDAAAFALGNAPNPFQTETTIRYSLDRDANVRLTVFDALGRQVATLVAAPQPAGDHTARWSAADVAPGVYIVRLQAGDAFAARQVLVVR